MVNCIDERYIDDEGFVVSDNTKQQTGGAGEEGLWVYGGTLSFNELLSQINLRTAQEEQKIFPKGEDPKVVSHPIGKEVCPQIPDSKNNPEDFQGVFQTLIRGATGKVADICSEHLPHPDEGKFWYERKKEGRLLYYIIKDKKQVLICEGIIFKKNSPGIIGIRLRGGEIGDITLIESIHQNHVPDYVLQDIDTGIETIARGEGTLAELKKNVTEGIEKHQETIPKSSSSKVHGINYTAHSIHETNTETNEHFFHLDITLGGVTYNIKNISITFHESIGYNMSLPGNTGDISKDEKVQKRFSIKSKGQLKALHQLIGKIKHILESQNPKLKVYKDFIESFQKESVTSTLQIPSLIPQAPVSPMFGKPFSQK